MEAESCRVVLAQPLEILGERIFLGLGITFFREGRGPPAESLMLSA